MGFFKVLGGAALGVGAIVALPVFGAVGTITAAGVAVGAAVGAAGGALGSKREETKRKEAYQRGQEAERANQASEITKLKEQLDKAYARCKEYREYEDLLVALFAVGMAVAACDGVVLEQERQEIEEFVSGVSGAGLPEETKSLLDKLYANPPSFNDALLYVNNVDREEWDVFDSVIEVIMHADGRVVEMEAAFKEAWKRYKTA